MFEKFWGVYTTTLPVVLGGLGVVFTILLPVALVGGLDSKKRRK